MKNSRKTLSLILFLAFVISAFASFAGAETLQGQMTFFCSEHPTEQITGNINYANDAYHYCTFYYCPGLGPGGSHSWGLGYAPREAHTYDDNHVCTVCGHKCTHQNGVSYSWSDLDCTGTISCPYCGCRDMETVTVNPETDYVKDADATCTAAETGHYVAKFTKAGLTDQNSSPVSKGVPLGHAYGDPVYTWLDDKCTAEMSCQRTGCTDEVTEEVTGTYEKDTDASCTEPEKGHYKATFTEEGFTEQVTPKDSVPKGDPLGHNWKNTYSWNQDKCTASQVCTVCSTVGETETVTAPYVKDTAATCTESEKGHYEATFTKVDFEKQSTPKDSVLHGSPLGHKWGDWVITKVATKDAMGTRYHDCTVCHYREYKNYSYYVQTGDSFSPLLWLGLMALSAFVATVIVLRRKHAK